MSEKSKKPKASAHQDTVTKRAEPSPVEHHTEEQPRLNADLLASYRDSHHRLLLVLCLVLAFVLSCFPISDPDIFFSLQVGKMVSGGEFPWGEDPFGFAAGEHAPWVHSGWLGDTIIYYLYLAGGGPLLVFLRAALVVFLFWLLMRLGPDRTPGIATVLTVLLGVVTISQRLYFRTELFSLVLLGVTFWLLTATPRCECWLGRLHQLTGGRWYWLLPVVFLLWANLDGWFFLGLVVVLAWCAGAWLTPNGLTRQQQMALTVATGLSLVASCCSPFHVKAFMEIPTRLAPPTMAELKARFEEQKQRDRLEEQKQGKQPARFTEQQRLFESPWQREFVTTQRGEAILSLASQAPFLPLCYPSGLSLSEWAYYGLTFFVLLSVAAGRNHLTLSTGLLILGFVLLGGWQSRFAGFFAVGGTALAVLLYQSPESRTPSLQRLAILGGQMLCLIAGITIQVLCLLHLIPTPDFSPSSLGHVHPRGSFGFAFRTDRSIEEACQELGRWRETNLVSGKPYHFDWTDVVAYDAWFNPGGRHFFDRRHEVQDAATTKAFIAANDAILAVAQDPLKRDRSNLARVLDRQARWQEVFTKYDIGYLIVKRRGQQQRELLVSNLLYEVDKDGQLVWKPLRLHNGQIYALAWVGSPHWKAMQRLEFKQGETVFRREKPFKPGVAASEDRPSLTRYLTGDAARRPAAVDEAAWHQLLPPIDTHNRVAADSTEYQLRTFAAGVAARLATPTNGAPMIPLLLSSRQYSASSTILSLDAARRAVMEISPATAPQHRLDAWLQYLDAFTMLINYEQSFTPSVTSLREPLRLFIVRQAALAAQDADNGPAMELHLQLARMYLAARAADAALEHYLIVRRFIERVNNENIEATIKKLEGMCQQRFGFAPAELANNVAKATEAWQQQVSRMTAQSTTSDPGRDVLNRAGLALQMGLPRLALEELLNSGVKSVEVSAMAAQIYTILGQHDIVLVEFLNRSPALRAAMSPLEFHMRASLGEWCLGHPDRAAAHRLAIAELVDDNTRKTMLDSGLRALFGTGTQAIGNVLQGTMQGIYTATESFPLSEEQIAAGLFLLEAGQPQRAAELFKKAILEVEPASPWRPLVEHYYLQITGEVMGAK